MITTYFSNIHDSNTNLYLSPCTHPFPFAGILFLQTRVRIHLWHSLGICWNVLDLTKDWNGAQILLEGRPDRSWCVVKRSPCYSRKTPWFLIDKRLMADRDPMIDNNLFVTVHACLSVVLQWQPPFLPHSEPSFCSAPQRCRQPCLTLEALFPRVTFLLLPLLDRGDI